MIAGFQLLKEGDIENRRFQELLFDMLLHSVHVGEEKIMIVLKYKKGESSTIEMPFNIENIDDVEGSHSRKWWSLGELMQTPPATNAEVTATLRLYHNLIVIEIPRVA